MLEAGKFNIIGIWNFVGPELNYVKCRKLRLFFNQISSIKLHVVFQFEYHTHAALFSPLIPKDKTLIKSKDKIHFCLTNLFAIQWNG